MSLLAASPHPPLFPSSVEQYFSVSYQGKTYELPSWQKIAIVITAIAGVALFGIGVLFGFGLSYYLRNRLIEQLAADSSILPSLPLEPIKEPDPMPIEPPNQPPEVVLETVNEHLRKEPSRVTDAAILKIGREACEFLTKGRDLLMEDRLKKCEEFFKPIRHEFRGLPDRPPPKGYVSQPVSILPKWITLQK